MRKIQKTNKSQFYKSQTIIQFKNLNFRLSKLAPRHTGGFEICILIFGIFRFTLCDSLYNPKAGPHTNL